jgi:hypothetical protein
MLFKVCNNTLKSQFIFIIFTKLAEQGEKTALLQNEPFYMLKFLNKISPFFVLSVLVLLGYWQVSFLVYPLKWDVIDVVFPFRYYFSECIRSGYFPFWNPYLQTGTPFFADLQAPVFYPELLFTSLFTRYGVQTMNVLFVLYAGIAAVGMYKLSFYFNTDRLASFIAAMAYSFSGFVIGHGQHFFLLVGVAWIPFVVYSYLVLCREKTFINTLKTAVFILLMVTGAYQALSFTLFYLLLLLFLYFIFNTFRKKDFKAVKDIVAINLLLLLLVVLFLLPLIISVFEIVSSVERLESGLLIGETVKYGQSLKALISCIFPYATVTNSEFFGGVDVSMRNHYFGIIPLLFFGAAFFQKRTALEYLILAFGVLFMAASFRVLGVRELLFSYVPFMNLFKYAAFIRIFGLLAFVLLAANYFSFFRKNSENEKTKVLVLGVALLLVLFFSLFYSLTKISSEDWQVISNLSLFKGFQGEFSFYQRIFIQAVFQIFIVSVFLVVLIFNKKIRRPFVLIAALIVFDLLMSVQLNVGATVTDIEHNPVRMDKNLALYPNHFPLPVYNKIIYNDNQHVSFPPFWRNTYTFSKQVSFISFSSFELNSYSKLDDDFPNLRNAVLNNHLFYFSDTICSNTNFSDDEIDSENNSHLLFFSDEDFRQMSPQKVKTDSTDLIRITAFSPNAVSVETETKNDQFFTMLQTNFKGWKVFVDGNETPVYTSNFNYRSILLPRGKHTISYEYKNTKILVAYIFSNLLFLAALLFLLAYTIRKKNSDSKMVVVIPVAVLFLFCFLLLKQITFTDENQTVHQDYEERWSESSAVFHLSQTFEEQPLQNWQIGADMEYFTLATINNKSKKITQGTLVVRARIYPDDYVKVLIVSDLQGSDQPEKWNAAKIETQIEKLNEWNDIIYYRNIYETEDTDLINLYLWNRNKHSFKIDDIRVDFYPFN